MTSKISVQARSLTLNGLTPTKEFKNIENYQTNELLEKAALDHDFSKKLSSKRDSPIKEILQSENQIFEKKRYRTPTGNTNMKTASRYLVDSSKEHQEATTASKFNLDGKVTTTAATKGIINLMEENPHEKIEITELHFAEVTQSDSKVHQLTNTNSNRYRRRSGNFVMKENQEIRIRHEIAQRGVKIIGDNLSLLRQQKERVKSYLSAAHGSTPISYSKELLDVTKELYFSRMRGIRDLYDLAKMTRAPGIADDQYDIVSLTPSVLEKSNLQS